MTTPKKPRDQALQNRVEQARNIYRLGTLSADSWVPASSLGVHERWDFFRRTSCLAYPVRNKCERICSKGLVLKTPKVFDDAKSQEALEQFWSREVPQKFVKPVYTYCATVGWCCATIVPDPRFGARPVCIPPTTPGLMLRWNEVGDVQATLCGDAMIGDPTSGTIGARGVITRVFGPLLGSATGALGVVTTTASNASAASVGGGGNPEATENAFDLQHVPPGFFFPPQHEIVFISLGPWDPFLRRVITPMDSIMSNVQFWEETRQLWLEALRERVHRPVFVAKPLAHGSGDGKNQSLSEADYVRADIPECKTDEEKKKQQYQFIEQRQTQFAAFVAERWASIRNYSGRDPAAVLPPSMGGHATSFGNSGRERRLKDGELVQRTDNFPDLPDTSQIASHLNEEACQSYGVPMSLGSRSSDSGQAKLWSTGGDEQAFRMYQQTCAQDSGGLAEVVKKMYVKCMGPNHVVSTAIRKMFEEERDKSKAAAANHRPEDRDGDTSMTGDRQYPKGQKRLVTKEFDQDTANDGKVHDEQLGELKAFENKVEIVMLGNIEMQDVQTAADAGHMSFENYRLFLAANTGLPLSMIEQEPQDPFRLKVAEREADIDANAKAKAKAKTAAATGKK